MIMHRYEITPEIYLEELACTRSFAKKAPKLPEKLLQLGANLLYPRHGLGHGFNGDNILLPPKDPAEWPAVQDEITRHAIVDRLAASALTGYMAGMHIISNKSGHKNDLEVMRRVKPKLVECYY